MFTLVKLSVVFLFVNMYLEKSILINTYRKEFKIYRKTCYCHYDCFSLVGNADNKFHLKLKEFIIILKLKRAIIPI